MARLASLLLVTCCLALAASGCNRRGARDADSTLTALPEGHVPIGRAVPLDPAAQVVLDSANASFAARRYEDALAQYRRTLDLAPGHPAPWYGISMAATVLGDSALADSAQRLLQRKGAGGAPHPAPRVTPANPHAPS
jgi:hypothetical protein